MPEPVTHVSFQACYAELVENGGPAAQRVYRDWRRRMQACPAYAEVVNFVEGFTHRFLFSVTEEMLCDARARSEHALGSLKREEAEDRRIEDFDTPFALQHLFHRFLEESSIIPTWQEWWAWLTTGAGKCYYVREVQRHFGWGQLQEEERQHLRESLQWRLGKFYYSAFREIELFTALRTQYRLPVKYHILADVLLRADLWMDKKVVSLFFENRRYREGTAGRKHRAEEIFAPGFGFTEMNIRRQGFGTFWRPHCDDIAALAQKLAAPAAAPDCLPPAESDGPPQL
jgi:hypothetical protein